MSSSQKKIIIIQFLILYVQSQQLQDQLQTQRSVDTGNYIMNKEKLQESTGGKTH
jgi:hypothetical protein